MRYLLSVVIAFTILATPALSMAATYSDDFNVPGMDATLWTSQTDPGGTPLYEANSVLNFTADGAYMYRWSDYASTWTFDLNNDFAMRTDFNFNYNGTGGVGVGLGIDQVGGDFSASIGAEKEASYDGGRSIFWSGIENGEITPWKEEDVRAITSGWLGLRYTSSTDKLEFGAFDMDNIQVGGAYYNGFRTYTGGGIWKAAVGGFADDFTVIIQGQANLDNFQAAVTPEPISMFLFLTGGAALAAARRLRKRA